MCDTHVLDGARAEPKSRLGPSDLSLADVTAMQNRLFFDTECGGFLYAADLHQTIIDKTFQDLKKVGFVGGDCDEAPVWVTGDFQFHLSFL
jgi:hypothetical protein